VLSLITCAALTLNPALPQEAAAQQAADPQKQLVALTDRMSKAKSYEFTIKTESTGTGTGGGFGGRDRGGRDAGRGGEEGGGEEGGADRPAPPQREPEITKGAFSAELPMHLTIGETEAYKDLDQIVYKNEAGEWTLFDRASMGGRGMRGGGGGGDAGGAGGRGERGGARGGQGGQGGDDTGGAGGRGDRGGQGGGEQGGGEAGGGRGQRGQRGFGGMNRGLFSLMRVTAPHEGLAGFGDKVTSVEMKAGEGDVVVYTGQLTEEAATELNGPGMTMRGGRAFGGRGGDDSEGPQFDTSGTFTISTKGGAITSAVFEVTVSGSFGENEFERKTTRSVTFDKVGKTEYEVPEAALALFEI